jgi:hypothetical protein
MNINIKLKDLLEKSKRKTRLFKDLQAHAFLHIPNHLIMKPLFVSMIFLNKFYT